MKKQVMVLDFETNEVYLYSIDKATLTIDYLQSRGFEINQCKWMESPEIYINDERQYS